MADIVYTVTQDSPETITGFEQYSEQDKALISSFQVNSVFDPAKHYSEIHILSLADDLLESSYTYNSYKLLGNAQSAGQAGASVITIDPIQDSKAYGYENGGVKLLYHFLNDLYTEDNNTVEFYIQDISPDRTEISLSTLNLSSEVITSTTSLIKTKLESQSYFTGFRLDFKNNDLFIATNIDTLDVGSEKVVVVKLYEPLPTTYGIKSTLNIVDIVSDSVAYEIDSEIVIQPEVAPTLRSPNFNIDIVDESVIPTQYYNYDELFSYPVNNANNQIFSTVSEKGIDISVDYTTFNDFIHFSSAQERLLNFKYKVDLIETYSGSIASIANATLGSTGVSGSRTYYEGLITGVVDNFDHYERFLYYESGSSSWPKSNTTKPYVNKLSTDPESITWYTGQIATAIEYDLTNYNSLVYSIPTYLRDDANNENYLTFVYMVGQHFDNLWLYAKAVTDKYDADNRIDFGISKDLVAEALRNFGVKLYTSNKSVEDLFSTFIGQSYQSGSEVINHYITGSLTGSNTPIQPTSYDNYQKEVQKRIYHNLPLLLKSKGTERGLRALINCLGIPGDILDIRLSGGRDTNNLPFFGDYRTSTSSIDKVRLDNTGSIVTGSTLSNSTSIVKRDKKYTDDLHVVEIGFSPTHNVDNYIISKSLADTSLSTFNIDEYIGNPSSLTQSSYEGLHAAAEDILGDLSQYDVRDYVRLIKFFDNTVFKMVKDFIPARAVADTGIIIKPNLLNRSKAKSVKASVDTILSASMDNAFNYTSSIDTAFTEGKHGNSFGAVEEYTTGYILQVNTPQGIRNSTIKKKEEAKFDGEFSNSKITVSTGELNRGNLLKKAIPPVVQFNVVFHSTPKSAVCPLNTTSAITHIVKSNTPTSLWSLFAEQGQEAPQTTKYYLGGSTTGKEIPPLYTFTGNQYDNIGIYADAGEIAGKSCNESATFKIVNCDLATGDITAPGSITLGVEYDLNTWFTLGRNNQVKFTVQKNQDDAMPVSNPLKYTFPGSANDTFKVTVLDSNSDQCNNTVIRQLFTCNIVPQENTVKTIVVNTGIDTPINVNLTSQFTGIIPTATYYTQAAENPTTHEPIAIDPNNWVEVTSPLTPANHKMIPRSEWVKVVNVPITCERVIKITRSSTAPQYGMIPLYNNPLSGTVTYEPNQASIACYGHYKSSDATKIIHQLYNYYYGRTTSMQYEDLLAILRDNVRLFTNSGLDDADAVNGWLSDGTRVYLFTDGYIDNAGTETLATSECNSPYVSTIYTIPTQDPNDNDNPPVQR